MKMNKSLYITILSLCIFTIQTFGQDFDDAFLASLPEDLADEIKEQAERKSEEEKPTYRKPSSYIDKPELKEERSSSERYGSYIFSMMQSSFMPINEPNFDGSYILDYGDELQIQLIGQNSYIKKLGTPVKKDPALEQSACSTFLILF